MAVWEPFFLGIKMNIFFLKTKICVMNVGV